MAHKWPYFPNKEVDEEVAVAILKRWCIDIHPVHAEAEALDTAIRKNLEILGYGG